MPKNKYDKHWCNCPVTKQEKFRAVLRPSEATRLGYKLTEVDSEGVCRRCGHHAVAGQNAPTLPEYIRDWKGFY